MDNNTYHKFRRPRLQFSESGQQSTRKEEKFSLYFNGKSIVFGKCGVRENNSFAIAIFLADRLGSERLMSQKS